MTKAEMIYPKIGIEPKQFTDTHQERCYPLTVVSDLMDEWAAQEVSKEREMSAKLAAAIELVTSLGYVSEILTKPLNEYKKSLDNL